MWGSFLALPSPPFLHTLSVVQSRSCKVGPENVPRRGGPPQQLPHWFCTEGTRSSTERPSQEPGVLAESSLDHPAAPRPPPPPVGKWTLRALPPGRTEHRESVPQPRSLGGAGEQGELPASSPSKAHRWGRQREEDLG